MAIRSNHYEAAFEAYIRALRVPCVAIDEARRAIFGEDGVKNPDFLLYPRFSTNLVVEVKGKRGKNARGRRDWENWVTTDDLDGLVRWQSMFGPGSAGWNTASGGWAWTTTSPTFGRAGRPGRRSPWPARPFAAGSARSRNGCR
jgi:hypothetical protein